ncbi:MAG: hypothetical protein HY657_18580 [Acidobacteria bacterium]|nr:hypothetical protein [Acidobacteriota bacterium]
MLFAELHGKLDPNAPDLERREDVLTSTTFGTLIVANATDVLVEWLNCARRFGARGRLDREPLGVVDERPVKYWFWPSLAGGTQPDVVLRIGHRLLVIEAKYGSVGATGRNAQHCLCARRPGGWHGHSGPLVGNAPSLGFRHVSTASDHAALWTPSTL